jgi:hypothetical protein
MAKYLKVGVQGVWGLLHLWVGGKHERGKSLIYDFVDDPWNMHNL